MHDPERRALSRAALVLLAVSLVRWGVAARSEAPAPPAPADALSGHIAATTAAVVEEDRRGRPLGEGERLDPNRATEVDLDRLPGVGPATARAIVTARDTGVTFVVAEDLLVVRGIGPATLDELRPLLRLPAAPAGGGRAPAERPPGTLRTMVDVNLADAAGLESLPGVGPALARRIIEERAVRPFASLEELERVRGIGPATIERLRGIAGVGAGW